MSKIRDKYRHVSVVLLFFLCIIISLYIYASYEKADEPLETINITNSINPKKKQEIGNNINDEDNTTIPQENNIMVAFLTSENETSDVVEIPHINELQREHYTSRDGIDYYVDSYLSIPKINLNYPVLSETSDVLLEHNLNKFWGGKPNSVGNYVIAGHNYNNKTYFGRLSELDIGDIIELTDVSDRTVTYQVYDMYMVDPTDVKCTSQLTDGKREVTLITCNATGSQRLVVKTVEVK